MRVCVCMCVCVCALWVYVCVCVCVLCVYMCVCLCVDVYVHTYICVNCVRSKLADICNNQGDVILQQDIYNVDNLLFWEAEITELHFMV